jgi:hypothetical protein
MLLFTRKLTPVSHVAIDKERRPRILKQDARIPDIAVGVQSSGEDA